MLRVYVIVKLWQKLILGSGGFWFVVVQNMPNFKNILMMQKWLISHFSQNDKENRHYLPQRCLFVIINKNRRMINLSCLRINALRNCITNKAIISNYCFAINSLGFHMLPTCCSLLPLKWVVLNCKSCIFKYHKNTLIGKK